MYPHRGDEEFFDKFMNVLSDLVEVVCPPSNMPEFARSGEPPGIAEGWTDVNAVAAGLANLTVEYGKDKLTYPRNCDTLRSLHFFRSRGTTSS